MFQRRLVLDSLRGWQTELTLVIICVLSFIILFWPIAAFKSVNEWESLEAWATYATWLAVIVAGFFTVRQLRLTRQQLDTTIKQLSESARTRQVDIVFELSKIYSTKEMFEALRTVHNYRTPEEIIDDPDKNFQRRMVSDFWNNMVAWAALHGLIELELIRSRWEQAIKEVWEKLRPLEIELRIRIERREHPDWDENRRREEAEKHVDTVLPLLRLYKIMAGEITP
jgi:hypothetical protein